MGSLKKSSYSEDSKLLIIHADDAGLSHSENLATMQALKNGVVNSYSIMMPCPWFYEMANFAKKNPHFDYGIHLTITCEWEEYKFGPVLPIDETPSLVDENGFFYKNRDDLRNNALNEDVRKEFKAQIEKALKFGLQPTHIDSHMYSVGSRPELLDIYRDLGNTYNLPVLINKELIESVGLESEKCIYKTDLLVDRIYLGNFVDFQKGKLKDYYNSVLDNLSAGFNMLITHPAFDDREMQGITKNHPNFGSEWRQIDFDYFTSEECKYKLKKNNIKLITWNEIKKRITTNNSMGLKNA